MTNFSCNKMSQGLRTENFESQLISNFKNSWTLKCLLNCPLFEWRRVQVSSNYTSIFSFAIAQYSILSAVKSRGKIASKSFVRWKSRNFSHLYTVIKAYSIWSDMKIAIENAQELIRSAASVVVCQICIRIYERQKSKCSFRSFQIILIKYSMMNVTRLV